MDSYLVTVIVNGMASAYAIKTIDPYEAIREVVARVKTIDERGGGPTITATVQPIVGIISTGEGS